MDLQNVAAYGLGWFLSPEPKFCVQNTANYSALFYLIFKHLP